MIIWLVAWLASTLFVFCATGFAADYIIEKVERSQGHGWEASNTAAIFAFRFALVVALVWSLAFWVVF